MAQPSALLLPLRQRFPPLGHSAEHVVEDLEEADEAEAHAKAEKAARVGDECDDGDLLVAHDPRDNGVLDVDVDDGQVLLGVDEDVFFKISNVCCGCRI